MLAKKSSSISFLPHFLVRTKIRAVVLRLLHLWAMVTAIYLISPLESFAQSLAPQRYTVHIDTDVSSSGCDAIVHDASGTKTLVGIDYQVHIDMLQRSTGTFVSAVTVAACDAGNWGSPSVLESGSREIATTSQAGKLIDHIEAAIPLTQLNVKPGQYLTLNVSASGDYLISPVSGAGPGSIGLTVPNVLANSATPVPLMSKMVLLLLMTALAIAGWWGIKTGRIRGKIVASICGIILTSSILATGLVSAAGTLTKISINDTSIADWFAISPLGYDPEGDQIPGTPDLTELYAVISDDQLVLRIDASREGGASPEITGNRDLSPIEKAGDLPRFISVPDLTAQLNVDWKYQARAIDSQGASIPVEIIITGWPSGAYISGVAPDQVIQWKPNAIGMHHVALLARDENGKTQAQQFLLGVSDDSQVPADPMTRATPLQPNVVTPFADSIKFLYDDTNPIQKDVSEGTIDPVRAAVLRGKVLDRSGNPLVGATVTIQGHTEFGYTNTRADGWFDIAVNGGGWVTIRVEKTGYLPAQRKVKTPWRDWSFAEDVVLIPYDNQYSQIDLTRNEVQTYWGGENNDHRGARRTTIVFPAGTKAVAEMADGSTTNLDHLTVRVSEYTIGNNGPQSMPGELPISVGYTWAANYSADEAEIIGAKHVKFNKPVYSYTTNFIAAPVGTAVPAGWYDFDQSAWVGSENGRVVQIKKITEGKAILRVTQANRDATLAELTALGIEEDELKALASMYPEGTQLWRTPIEHFTPWDFNWPWGPPPDGPPPPDDNPPPDDPPPPELPPDPDNPENEDPSADEPGEDIDCGCDVYVKQRAVGQSIPLKGTPFSLYYRSDVSGRDGVDNSTALRTRLKTNNFIPHVALKYTTAQYQIAGKLLKKQWATSQLVSIPEFDQNSWDGVDVYGRTVTSGALLRTTVAYGYQGTYYSLPSEFNRAFESVLSGSSKGTSFSPGSPGAIPTLEVKNEKPLKVIKSNNGIAVAQANAGGWMVQNFRFFDADRKIITESNGLQKSAKNMLIGSKGLNKISIKPNSSAPIRISKDGNVLSADTSRILSHNIDNFEWETYSVIAGQDYPGFSGDGGLAKYAEFDGITIIEEAVDGAIYVMDLGNRRLRKIFLDGSVDTIAGNGSLSQKIYNENPSRSTDVGFEATSLAPMPDGSVLAVTALNQLVQVTTAGYILPILMPEDVVKTVVSSSDGEAWIGTELGMIKKLYRLTRNGSIQLINFVGDLKEPASGPNGSLLIPSDTKLIAVSKSGQLSTVIDTSVYQSSSPISIRSVIGYTNEVGYLYKSDYGNVIRASVGLPEFTGGAQYMVGTEAGALYEVFSLRGTPMELRSAFTGATIARYTYNDDGYFITSTDGNGNTIYFDRTANRITRIVGRDGQVTALSYGGDGLLNQVTEPGGAKYLLSYNSKGLLSRFTNPNGGVDEYTYDSKGKLTSTRASDGSGWNISKNADNIITSRTAEGSIKSVQQYSYGSRLIKTTTGFNGLKSRKVSDVVLGYYDSTTSENFSVSSTKAHDPVFGSISSTHASSISKNGLLLRKGENRTAAWDEDRYLAWSSKSYVNGAIREDRFINLWEPTIETISPHGGLRKTVLNDLMQPLSIWNETGSTVLYQYDSGGRTSRIEEMGYDGESRYIDINYHPAGSNGAGNISKITNVIGQESTYEYNSAGQMIKNILPDGRSATYLHDPMGNVIQVTNPSGTIHKFSYDSANQPSAYNSPQGVTRWQYDLERKPVKVVRPDSEEIQFGYDNSSRLSQIHSNGGSVSIQYDALGQEESIVNQNQKISFQRLYGILNKRIFSGAVNGSLEYVIDNKANVKKILIASGSDNVELPVNVNESGRINRVGPYWNYYDGANRIVGSGSSQVGVQHIYSSVNELANTKYSGLAVSAPSEVEATRAHLLSQVRVLRDAIINEIQSKSTCRARGWYYFGPINSEVSIWQWKYDTISLSEDERRKYNILYGAPKYQDPELCLDVIRSEFTYLEESIEFGNVDSWVVWIGDSIKKLRSATDGGAIGIAALKSESSEAVVDATSYNSVYIKSLYEEVLKLISDFETANHRFNFPFEFTYDRDDLGRIIKQTERILSVSQEHEYSYDTAGRLIKHSNGGVESIWGYDANGNRTHENGGLIGTYDDEDRLLSWKGQTYQYTEAGDLKQKTDASGSSTYKYDSLGNLQQVQLPGGNQITYIMDPLNRRIGKKKNGVLQYGLIYQDDLRPIAETKPEGGIRSIFIYAEKSNVPSAMIKDGKSYQIVSDHLGSVRAVIDEATNEIKQQIEYNVWGQITSDTNPGFQPFGFAGGLYDSETGLIRFGARDYDPEVGRWTAKDPILFNGGDLNIYGYVANDPVNLIDRNGKSGQPPTFGQNKIPFNEINLIKPDPSQGFDSPSMTTSPGDGINISISFGAGPAISGVYNTQKGLTYIGGGVGFGARCTITKVGPQIILGEGAGGLTVQVQGSFGNGVIGANGNAAFSNNGSTISTGWGVGNIGASATATIGWRR